uniref:Uncharacterized protein n=1 Tax=Pyrodinium bahamense TaxID=73915 RepID=A0A7S0B2J9_9DINO|mmetsp:Transcript_47307/g.131573  ORF Transcript_47307/g.131573 Transcript_47307/m.131573 type:complete len:118 (+) Transcript_47307:91-444(+)
MAASQVAWAYLDQTGKGHRGRSPRALGAPAIANDNYGTCKRRLNCFCFNAKARRLTSACEQELDLQHGLLRSDALLPWLPGTYIFLGAFVCMRAVGAGSCKTQWCKAVLLAHVGFWA